MKIAVITAATNTIPRFRIDMIDEFIRRGADVVVFGDEQEKKWEDYFHQRRILYRSYEVSRNGMNPVKDLQTQKQLQKLLELENPDKVFTYQAKPNIYGSIAAHRVGIKDIYVMMGGLGSVFRSNDIKSRIIGAIVGAEYKYALKFARKVFFQNHEDVNLFISRKIVHSDKVVMTRGSGVNLNQFPARPLPEKDVFLFVGRLVRGKGVLDFLEAAKIIKKEYSDVEFHIVGPFDTNPTAVKPIDLEPYINGGIVQYFGEQENVQPFLERCSCFVLPSYYGEGTPKSALEAMATARPVIVADAVGCREVVENNNNGFLVSPKSPKDIATAMKKIITNRTLRQNMAKKSRMVAEKKFDVCSVNETICEVMSIDVLCKGSINE